MTTFNVDAAYDFHFPISLTGTIDITGGVITSINLAVPGLQPITVISQSSSLNGVWWSLTGTNAGATRESEDFISILFSPVPGPFLINFTQARILDGTAVHNSYDPITTIGRTEYHGLALSGTICPLEGCTPFPIHVVPGPVLGSGIGLLALGLFFLRKK